MWALAPVPRKEYVMYKESRALLSNEALEGMATEGDPTALAILRAEEARLLLPRGTMRGNWAATKAQIMALGLALTRIRLLRILRARLD